MASSRERPGWMTGVNEWQTALRGELSQLPETLKQLREAAANIQLVSKRLADATAGLEQLTTMTTALAEAQRRVDALASTLPIPRPGADTDERVRKAVDDVRDALQGM